MPKIIALIDGFNLYHSIEERIQLDPSFERFKWLNIDKLIKLYAPKGVEKILYFTSLTPWDADKVARHKIYIKALESTGVEMVYGKFKDRDRKCPKCGMQYKSREEKQTDVSIALTLFRSAYEKYFEEAILLTGDSDQLPTIKEIHRYIPGFRIGMLFPLGREVLELKTEADYYKRVRTKALALCRFDEKLILRDGSTLECPDHWRTSPSGSSQGS